MARSTGIVLAAGAITAANELLFAPLAGVPGARPWHDLNWRIIPATAGLALALAGLEHLAPGFAVGLAWLTLASILIVPVGKAPTPLENAIRVLGYK